MILNILICTGAMWVLQNFLILPLSSFFAEKKLLKMNLPNLSEGIDYDDLPIDEKNKADSVLIQYFIALDIVILGIAGFLAGYLYGIYFIGVSFDKTGWPGMMAFIILSIVGSYIL